MLHQRSPGAPRVAKRSRKHVVAFDPESLKLFGGEITTSAARIFADIAKDIGELHCDTQCSRASHRGRSARPDMRHHSKNGAAHGTDAAGDPLTVRLEVGPGCVFAIDQVQLQPREKLVQQLVRHVETFPGARQFPEDRVVGALLQGAKCLIAIPVKCIRGPNVGGDVNQVVGGATGGIDGEHAAPLFRREQSAGH